MFKNLLKLSISLCLLLTACGGGGGGGGGACSTLKIANGEKCESKTNPVVLLETNNHYCTGVIITRTSVLTTAACLSGARSMKVTHRRGAYQANKGYYNNYIGIIKVSPEFTAAIGVGSTTLNISDELKIGSTATIFGFGLTETGQLSLDYPKAAFVEITSAGAGFITAVGKTGYAKTGDGGGPLVYNNAIAGIELASQNNTQNAIYADLAYPLNYSFIMDIASDVATKSSIQKNLDEKLATEIEWASEDFDE